MAATGFVAASVLAAPTASALDDAPPSSTESVGEGSGYGGSSDWLLVEVDRGRLHLRGGGFQADSDVEIEIGSRSSTVRANELGNVDVWLEVSGDELIVARGVAADGSARVVTPAVSTDTGTSSLRTTLAIALGAAGAWVVLRNPRRPAMVPFRRPGFARRRRLTPEAQLPRP